MEGEQMQKDEEILEAVLAEFKELAKIPRKSGHEAKVSQYLFNYMKSLGLEVKQDEKLNIIADKPAAPGYFAGHPSSWRCCHPCRQHQSSHFVRRHLGQLRRWPSPCASCSCTVTWTR